MNDQGQKCRAALCMLSIVNEGLGGLFPPQLRLLLLSCACVAHAHLYCLLVYHIFRSSSAILQIIGASHRLMTLESWMMFAVAGMVVGWWWKWYCYSSLSYLGVQKWRHNLKMESQGVIKSCIINLVCTFCNQTRYNDLGGRKGIFVTELLTSFLNSSLLHVFCGFLPKELSPFFSLFSSILFYVFSPSILFLAHC